MRTPLTKSRWILAILATTAILSASSHAQASDFFSMLFGADASLPPIAPRLGYGSEDGLQFPPRPAPPAGARSSSAYCVRTCDGRYFPVSANGEQSRAATCNSLCPASETKVFYGSTIDNATTDSGKSYSALPNAFKYREQLVAGCTCNGKDSVGLASIAIADDKTLRKGDIVAGNGGLVVANQTIGKRRGAVARFSPVPERIRAKFARMPAAAVE